MGGEKAGGDAAAAETERLAAIYRQEQARQAAATQQRIVEALARIAQTGQQGN